MKRYLCLFLILALICPCFLVGASAAEIYYFEPLPNIEYYDDFVLDRIPDASGFYYDGVFPSGEYYFQSSMVFQGLPVVLKSAVFSVPYSSDESQLFFADEIVFEALFPDGSVSIIPVYIVGLNIRGIATFFCDSETFNGIDLIPYLEAVSVVVQYGLSGFLSADMFDFALDEVVSLLPVLLGCVVSFLGIRKGIAWLQHVVKGA